MKCVCVCVYIHIKHKTKILCDPMDYTVHGILQDRMLEWVVFHFFRSSQPRDKTQVSCIAGGFFTSWATREAWEYWSGYPIPSSADLPDPGIKLGSPPLQANSLPTELSEKPSIFQKCNKILLDFLSQIQLDMYLTWAL